MNYDGKLYGKINGVYFDTGKTGKDCTKPADMAFVPSGDDITTRSELFIRNLSKFNVMIKIYREEK